MPSPSKRGSSHSGPVKALGQIQTAASAIVTAALLWRFKKLPEPVIVVAAALIGLLVHPPMTRT
jgi:hypothetical protein